MKTKYVLAIVCALAILIGTVSGYAASGVLYDKSMKGVFDQKVEKEKIEAAKFEAKAESMGMTLAEFKAYLLEQFEDKAKSMGMSMSEYKEYLAEHKK